MTGGIERDLDAQLTIRVFAGQDEIRRSIAIQVTHSRKATTGKLAQPI
jgi:hypothetical protein